MTLDRCPLPVVLAPLAGGPSTPELCAAVSEAGGLGFLAAGYLSASELAGRLEQTRGLTDRPVGVNLFHPQSAAAPEVTETYERRVGEEAARADVSLGVPGSDDDDWTAKVELLASSPVDVVSVTFGCPSVEDMTRLRATAREVWVTVTSVEEARQALGAGADGLVVQGVEAGGHRGGFSDETDRLGLLPLLQLIRQITSAPLVATGGIMTGPGLAAVLAAGARAGALGTAFLRCPEAGTSQVHRDALARADRSTALTRAFTGRFARGIRNRFLDAYSENAPAAYPRVHFLTAPLRARGRTTGDAEVVNLWAGEAYPLALDLPAGDIVRRLAADARTALEESSRLLG